MSVNTFFEPGQCKMSGRMHLQAIRLSNEDVSPPISMTSLAVGCWIIPAIRLFLKAIWISDKSSSIDTLKHHGMCLKNIFPALF